MQLQTLQSFLPFFFYITREYNKTNRSILITKNQDFNELRKAFMEMMYFCFLQYFSARCREIIMLAIFLIMQSELIAIPS